MKKEILKDNKLTEIEEYEYNDKGNLIRRTIREQAGGFPVIVEEIKYNDKGNPVESKQTGQGGRTKLKTFSYNEEGKLVGTSSQENYTYEGEKTRSWVNEQFRYDENGRKTIEYTVFAASDQFSTGSITSETRYEYDDQGKLVRSTSGSAGSKPSDFKKYEYDENGNLKRETEENQFGSKTVKEFDNKGNITQDIWYTSEKYYRTDYEYDREGNQIKATRKDKDRKIESITEFRLSYK